MEKVQWLDFKTTGNLDQMISVVLGHIGKEILWFRG